MKMETKMSLEFWLNVFAGDVTLARWWHRWYNNQVDIVNELEA